MGRTVGDFTLRERIGEGGFGVVYRATQPALDREAVVKLLHTRLRSAKAATERFLREAKLASKLDHPYAAHIYAFGAEPDGALWIAMELVRGTPLDQILRIQGPLPLERFVPLLDRICEVVHTAHEQGIVHRDLKPANVMVLSRAGRLLPKLLDFGIAKGLASSSRDLATDETIQDGVDEGFAQTVTPPNALTQRGAVMGSPLYMAPEQWQDAGQVDGRTDLYALGVLAYEALTGAPPFTGTTIAAVAAAHATEEPAPLGGRFPPALDRVLAKVLAKEPEGRYSDALAFAAAFRSASGISAEPVSLPAIDPARRDAAVNTAPQPIAEAVAAFEAARNAHQARDGLVALARTCARYLGLLALACRSRVRTGDTTGAEAIRTLYRRPLTDKEWIELTRDLTRVWLDRRDAYPVPELVDAFHDPSTGAVEHLEALEALRATEAVSEDTLLGLLDKAVARTTKLLEALAFLNDYSLVVTVTGGVAERWMGVRRAQRTTLAVRGKSPPAGVPALLDKDGIPVLTLAPLIQVAAPTPGAPLDLFLLAGRDRHGAKLVTLPAGFELHDDTLWDWFRGQLIDSFDATDHPEVEERPPYRGLSAFSPDDGGMFFGREKLVDGFVNRLRVQPLLAVVGRSGSGKTSFVQAGVIPALPAGWRALTMRPGGSPLAALCARLAQAGFATDGLRVALAGDRNALGELLRADAETRGPILLVVDQLEELFTLCLDADERRVFAEAVAAAARVAEDPVRVVFTLRDDFLLRTEQVAALRNRIGQGLQLLAVPVAEDLTRILVEPARRLGYEFEPATLPAEMVKEVADQPGALALISFTAAKLWELRDRHFKQLTAMAYKSLGGVGGALARLAELTLDEMPPEERRLVREAFRYLVTTQNTRAVLERRELRQLLGGSEHAEGVMEKLVGARLLVASENEAGAETIEIVHEAMLVAWPRLVDWRREDNEGARLREQLRAAAKQWDERGRPKGLLWRGDALAEYTRWRARHAGPLADVEAAFAGASVSDAARGRTIRRALLGSVLVVLVAGVITLLTLTARIDTQRQRAEEGQQQVKDSLAGQYEEQGRLALLQNDKVRAMLYLDKAFENGADTPALHFLASRAARNFDDQLAILDAHAGAVQRETAYLTPDASAAIAAYSDGVVRVWDVRERHVRFALPDHVASERGLLRLSRDGTLALDNRTDNVVRLWSVATGETKQSFRHDSEIVQLELSPDQQRVITVDHVGHGRLWNVRSGARVADLEAAAPIYRIAFSPDSYRIAAGDMQGNVRIWDAQGKQLQSFKAHTDWVWSTVFSPDSSKLLTTSSDKEAKIWDAQTGALLRVASVHTDTVEYGMFDSTGALVVTSGMDGTVHVWSAETGKLAATLPVKNRALDLAFDRSGKILAICGGDGTVALWDIPSGILLAGYAGHANEVSSVAFDGEGTRLLTAGADGTLRLWNARSASAVVQLRAAHGAIGAASFDAGGTRVVSATENDAVDLWDLASRSIIATFRSGIKDASFYSAAASPDGRLVAAAGSDRAIHIWEVASQRSLHHLPQGGNVFNVSFGPDHTLLWAADTIITVWSIDSARALHRLAASSPIVSARFDRTGTRIVTASVTGLVEIWDVAGERVTNAFGGARGMATDASFSHDGTRIVSAHFDSIVEVWEIESRRLTTLAGHTGVVLSAEFSPDDTFVLTTSIDKTARIWDAASFRVLARVDSRAGAFGRAAFSPTGERIATAGEDGVVRVWDVRRDRWTPAAISQFVRCKLPLALVDGRFIPHTPDCP
ncbi:MAG: serine/threonine-protein kinase [Kofleriaceae bacterium]